MKNKDLSSRVWTLKEIEDLLATSKIMVIRSTVAIYQLQTEDERNLQDTRESNGVGFSAYDAEFMTQMAERSIKGQTISPKQFFAMKNKIVKYRNQLLRIANKELPGITTKKIDYERVLDRIS